MATLWIPLESNPDVLTKYIHELGVSDEWCLTDVMGLEPDMLEWVPKPVKAMILLFPCSEAYEQHRREENERLLSSPETHPDDLFYMRQCTPNACGTVALIHSIANAKGIQLKDGILKNFLENVSDMTPEKRGEALENDKKFSEGHQSLAQEGQTPADPNTKVFHHFVAIVNKGDVLYELDGRKQFPVKHGDTSEETFVADAAKVCKEFMKRDPSELRFTVLALAAAQD
ncbi:ubiquitin carboxyl-terminal hydrolase [Teleopsis dalmanni]|uniref:ubiquitin carboxyl-terminal hydrolase n=1 Tax=Teleopsis dalmanni TaxID=139649 RepID=UPI0018CF93DA|nr:ubiquitin carboxyl-terminal hydrolase [Teleopsis dalmanni]